MNCYSTNRKQGLVSSAALAWALKNTTWVTLVDYQLEVDKGSLQLCHSKSEKLMFQILPLKREGEQAVSGHLRIALINLLHKQTE